MNTLRKPIQHEAWKFECRGNMPSMGASCLLPTYVTNVGKRFDHKLEDATEYRARSKKAFKERDYTARSPRTGCICNIW